MKTLHLILRARHQKDMLNSPLRSATMPIVPTREDDLVSLKAYSHVGCDDP